MKGSQAQGRPARTALDAAAASMARGASGFWLRAGSRLGLAAAARCTCWSATSPSAWRWPPPGERRAGEQRRSRAGGRGSCWGRIPLVLLVAGLAAYALTQLLEAVFRLPAPRHDGQVAAACGVVMGVRAVLGLLPEHRPAAGGNPSEADGPSEQRQDAGVTADLLRTGWGQALLVLAGILVVAGGLEAGRRAVRLNFRERFTAGHMSRALAIITRALGAFGSVARAVVFVLTGVFLIKAAVLSARARRRGWTRSSVRWPARTTVRGCWGCSPAACSATAFTAWSRPGTRPDTRAISHPRGSFGRPLWG